MLSMMTPVLALACWSLVMWLWMYATRIPAMQKAGLDPAKIKQKGDLDVLPLGVRQIADNYNHLHEQPVIFYALCVYSHISGVVNEVMVAAAWAYVILRVAHSIFQATVNFVPVRFVLFSLSSITLIVMAVANVMRLINP
ncbi:MAPEG family protein [Maricaulaceae bacterium EIL42A08]|nr:MAPEG family protein [Maricaulaceae bacterium EIL42A08]